MPDTVKIQHFEHSALSYQKETHGTLAPAHFTVLTVLNPLPLRPDFGLSCLPRWPTLFLWSVYLPK